MLKTKAAVTDVLRKFILSVETQFHKVVKQVRSDNAKELALTDFLQSKGITHQFSCVQRPEQNAVSINIY